MKKTRIGVKCTGLGFGDNGCGQRIGLWKKDIFAIPERCKSVLIYCYYYRCPYCGKKTEFPEEELSSNEKLIAITKLL